MKDKSVSPKSTQLSASPGGPRATQAQRRLCPPAGLLTRLQHLQTAISEGLIQPSANYPHPSLKLPNRSVSLTPGPLWPPPALGSPAPGPEHFGQDKGPGEVPAAPPRPAQHTLYHGHVASLLLAAVCFGGEPAGGVKPPRLRSFPGSPLLSSLSLCSAPIPWGWGNLGQAPHCLLGVKQDHGSPGQGAELAPGQAAPTVSFPPYQFWSH